MNGARTLQRIVGASLLCGASVATLAQDEQPEKNINNFIVDINGGAVSAAGIVGLDTAITPIETSQDFIMAIQPLTSDNRKAAFGLAITPAKTTMFPMAGSTYSSSAAMRLLGNLTLSYAQNKSEHGGQQYRRWGLSVDTVYHFNREHDPVHAGSRAFKTCADQTAVTERAKRRELVDRLAQDKITKEEMAAEEAKLSAARGEETQGCIASELSKTPWNSGRLSVSFGQGRISPVTGDGAAYSLGQHVNLNAQYPIGSKGLIQTSLRHARNALDPNTLGQAQPDIAASRLAALRYTYGGDDGTDLRIMAEASTARQSSASAFRDAFMYALGVDKKLAKGMWLEFRLGRNRANENGTEQTAGLINLNVAPTLFTFKQ
jgi:hypothetical protein